MRWLTPSLGLLGTSDARLARRPFLFERSLMTTRSTQEARSLTVQQSRYYTPLPAGKRGAIRQILGAHCPADTGAMLGNPAHA